MREEYNWFILRFDYGGKMEKMNLALAASPVFSTGSRSSKFLGKDPGRRDRRSWVGRGRLLGGLWLSSGFDAVKREVIGGYYGREGRRETYSKR